jgi:hypothetical protein
MLDGRFSAIFKNIQTRLPDDVMGIQMSVHSRQFLLTCGLPTVTKLMPFCNSTVTNGINDNKSFTSYFKNKTRQSLSMADIGCTLLCRLYIKPILLPADKKEHRIATTCHLRSTSCRM